MTSSTKPAGRRALHGQVRLGVVVGERVGVTARRDVAAIDDLHRLAGAHDADARLRPGEGQIGSEIP